MTTVLIVDDHALQRFGFRMLLEQHPDLTVVGEAAHGTEAVRKAAELRPDVVLMDVRMPGMDGIEATRRIVKSGGRSHALFTGVPAGRCPKKEAPPAPRSGPAPSRRARPTPQCAGDGRPGSPTRCPPRLTG
jgi:CheY-like chemotaxis protein